MQDALDLVIAADELVFHAIYRPAIDHRLVQEATPAANTSHSREARDRARSQLPSRTPEKRSRNGAGRRCAGGIRPRTTSCESWKRAAAGFSRRAIPAPPYIAGRRHSRASGDARSVHRAPILGGLPRHKLERVLRFIREHIEAAIHVNELAATAHMSAYHFARMFKEATGIPPHRYITFAARRSCETVAGRHRPATRRRGRRGWVSDAGPLHFRFPQACWCDATHVSSPRPGAPAPAPGHMATTSRARKSDGERRICGNLNRAAPPTEHAQCAASDSLPSRDDEGARAPRAMRRGCRPASRAFGRVAEAASGARYSVIWSDAPFSRSNAEESRRTLRISFVARHEKRLAASARTGRHATGANT